MEMASKGTDLVVDGLARIAEAGAFLGLSRSKLYELMDAGDLPFVLLGRSRRIPRRVLVELAARHLNMR